MTAEQTKARLYDSLNARGFDWRDASPRLAWVAFLQSCSNGLDNDGNGLLFQWGTYTFSGQSLFNFSLVRQFTHPDPDNDEFLQLELLLTRAPDAATENLGSGSLWSSASEALVVYSNKVEGLEVFRACLKLDGWTARVSINET